MAKDVVAVFEHPPGRDSQTESYIIGDVQGVLSQLDWGTRKLGKLKGIVPAWDGCPTNEYFVLVWSFSLQSRAAQAMYAREQLKQLLPRRLRELFLERRLTEVQRVELSKYLALNDFWNAATGHMAPSEAARLAELPLFREAHL